MRAWKNLTQVQLIVFAVIVILFIVGIISFIPYFKDWKRVTYLSASGSGPNMRPTCTCPTSDSVGRPFICEALGEDNYSDDSEENIYHNTCEFTNSNGFTCNIMSGLCEDKTDENREDFNTHMGCLGFGVVSVTEAESHWSLINILDNSECKLVDSDGTKYELACGYCDAWETPAGSCSSSPCEIGTCRQPTGTYDKDGNCVYTNSPDSTTCIILDSECKSAGVGACSSGACVPNPTSCPDTSCGSSCSPTSNGWSCECKSYKPSGAACNQNGFSGKCSGASGRCITSGVPYPVKGN